MVREAALVAASRGERGYTMPSEKNQPAADPGVSETPEVVYSPLSFSTVSPVNTVYGGDQVQQETSADNG